MLLKTASDIQSSEITPQSIYLNRRKFIACGSAAAAGLAMGRAVLELVSPHNMCRPGRG
jgi:sulfoxide reductase catalytic subunit YedY